MRHIGDAGHNSRGTWLMGHGGVGVKGYMSQGAHGQWGTWLIGHGVVGVKGYM